jgi:hypothetical protein
MRASSADPAPRIFSVSPDHAIATWNDFLLQIWRGATTLEAARIVRAAARHLAAERPGAIATLIVVEQTASLPDREPRAELARMASDQAGRMVGAALVHEGEGFRAAAVRSAMVGMMLLARNAFPHEVVADFVQACAWLAKERRLDPGDIARLPRVAEEVRATIGR